MTPAQSRQLLDDLFITYPHLDAYVQGLPHPQGTIDEWRRLVAKLEYTTTSEAVRRLRDGEAEIPTKPWEISMLPFFLRGVAGRVADDRAKFARAETLREAQREAKPGRNAAAAASFAACRKIAMAAGACKFRGEITKERKDEIMAYLRHINTDRPNALPEVPDDIRHEHDDPKPTTWHVSKRQPMTESIRILK
jgi:hypothetical protein